MEYTDWDDYGVRTFGGKEVILRKARYCSLCGLLMEVGSKSYSWTEISEFGIGKVYEHSDEEICWKEINGDE